MSLRVLVLLVLVAGMLWWLLRGRVALRPRVPPPGWDPYAVLGVRSGASPDELTHAYREQMKRYHPDRVADMPAEFQELAHRKALEIQRAYTELRRPKTSSWGGGNASV